MSDTFWFNDISLSPSDSDDDPEDVGSSLCMRRILGTARYEKFSLEKKLLAKQ